MSAERLRLLLLTLFPPSPATFGAQRRIQGLMRALGRRHHLTAVSLVPPSMDAVAAEQGMRELGAEAIVVASRPGSGLPKRVVQLRSLLSRHSFERRFYTLPELQRVVDALLRRHRHDIVHVEFPFLSHYGLRQAPPGEPLPRLVLDEHNVEFDLVRQMTGAGRGLVRHLYNSVDWRKVRREEVAAWRSFDGVMFTSSPDEGRARALVPAVRSRVIPNAVDVDFFRPRPGDPPSDGRTVLFFGTFDYFPNHDGVLHFLREAWPLLAARHPGARLQIVGAGPPPEVRAFQGPRVEISGLVEDVRPHLARAGAVVVPLRIGGGTRLKILESMAMAKAIVSTRLGAEGIEAVHERDLLLADGPEALAAALARVLDDRGLAARMGAEARGLVERRYSWEVAAEALERFYREILARSGRPA